MSYIFKVQEKELICEGEGLKILRLKSALASFLGPGSIKTISPKIFSLSLVSASAASPVFTEICGSVPDVLANSAGSYVKHGIAREKVIVGLLENRVDNLEAPWPGILDQAQAVAVTAMTSPDLLGLCLFDEQGIGKSVTTLAAFDVLFQRNETDTMVIVCPVTMMENWQKEIERFVPGKYKISVVTGTPEQKRKKILSPFQILICNFETVPSLLVVLKTVLGGKKTVLAVDESFNVKNKEAYRSVAIKELRDHCVRSFVMCGTPAPNSPLDVIHQFDIADHGYTFAGFTAPKDEAALFDAISDQIEERGVFVRRLKEQVLPFLPEKQFKVLGVHLTGRQAALYEEARSKLEINLRSMDNAVFKKNLASYFQQRSAMLQICACPEAIDPMFGGDSAKILVLDQLVDEVIVKGGRKLIVWSFYKNSLERLRERYRGYSPVLLDGSSSALERAEAVQKFQTDPSVRMCIANPAAAGAGVTLHAASDAAYVSFSNQAAHFLQSVDRIHRRGQKAQVTSYYLLVCQGTIEETEVERLRAKEVRQHDLLGDQIKWPNSLDEALAELKKTNEKI